MEALDATIYFRVYRVALFQLEAWKHGSSRPCGIQLNFELVLLLQSVYAAIHRLGSSRYVYKVGGYICNESRSHPIIRKTVKYVCYRGALADGVGLQYEDQLHFVTGMLAEVTMSFRCCCCRVRHRWDTSSSWVQASSLKALLRLVVEPSPPQGTLEQANSSPRLPL